ncbi:MAG TPA: glycosyltransferase family 39 protein [Patescibacteria group bacterium]|nr:glycosyltransferase family 39 protein [Patescibacteria group bacterium]
MPKVNLTFKRVDYYLLSLLAVLLLYLVFSYVTLGYAILHSDSGRDYLIAQHIVKFGEIPLTGPVNSLVVSIKNSPVYFYLLAFFISILDDPNFISAVNILAQLISIVLVYFLGKLMFGKWVGLASSVMYAFSPMVLDNSITFWQPSIMNPFINLSLLLLAIAYFKEKSRLVPLSVAVFILATALHPSPLALIPAFAAASVITLRKLNRPQREIIHLLNVAVLTAVILFLPVAVSKVASGTNLLYVNLGGKFIRSASELVSSLSTNMETLMAGMIDFRDRVPDATIGLAFGLALLLCLLFLTRKGLSNSKEAWLILFIFFSAVSFIVIASFTTIRLRIDHFLPILSLIFILMAALFNLLIQDRVILKILSIVVIAGLVNIPNRTQVVIAQDLTPRYLQEKSAVDEIVNYMEKEISNIQAAVGYSQPNFFRIANYKIYKGNSITPVYDSPYIVRLEKSLNHKLVTINDFTNLGYSSINSSDYVFVICQSMGVEADDDKCIADFIKGIASNSILPDQAKSNFSYSTPVKIHSNKLLSLYQSKKL